MREREIEREREREREREIHIQQFLLKRERPACLPLYFLYCFLTLSHRKVKAQKQIKSNCKIILKYFLCSNSCNSTLFFIAHSITPHSESLEPTKCIWKLAASAVPSVVRILQLSKQSVQVSCFSMFDWNACN